MRTGERVCVAVQKRARKTKDINGFVNDDSRLTM